LALGFAAEKLTDPLVILASASWACGSRPSRGVDYGHFTLAKPAASWWPLEEAREPEEREETPREDEGTEGDDEESERPGGTRCLG
jgi:hypothetical protein